MCCLLLCGICCLLSVASWPMLCLLCVVGCYVLFGVCVSPSLFIVCCVVMVVCSVSFANSRVLIVGCRLLNAVLCQ